MPRHLSYSPLAIVVCFVVGVCIVRICDLVTIDHDETVNFEKVDRETLHMGDSFEHLMWFVQVIKNRHY